MRIEKDWIGVQFNWIIEKNLKPSYEQYKSLGLETDGEQIVVNIYEDELDAIEAVLDSKKVEIARKEITDSLKYSDYTNIYTYLNIDSLMKTRESIVKIEFENERKRVERISDKNQYIKNFENLIKSEDIKHFISGHPLMVLMNHFFELVANRDFELVQNLSLELTLETKEEWGTKNDNLNVSIQLDKIEENK